MPLLVGYAKHQNVLDRIVGVKLLEEYDIAIIHQPGTQHGNADDMSTKPCNQCGMRDDEDTGSIYAAHVPFTRLQDEWWNLCQIFSFSYREREGYLKYV